MRPTRPASSPLRSSTSAVSTAPAAPSSEAGASSTSSRGDSDELARRPRTALGGLRRGLRAVRTACDHVVGRRGARPPFTARAAAMVKSLPELPTEVQQEIYMQLGFSDAAALDALRQGLSSLGCQQWRTSGASLGQSSALLLEASELTSTRAVAKAVQIGNSQALANMTRGSYIRDHAKIARADVPRDHIFDGEAIEGKRAQKLYKSGICTLYLPCEDAPDHVNACHFGANAFSAQLELPEYCDIQVSQQDGSVYAINDGVEHLVQLPNGTPRDLSEVGELSPFAFEPGLCGTFPVIGNGYVGETENTGCKVYRTDDGYDVVTAAGERRSVRSTNALPKIVGDRIVTLGRPDADHRPDPTRYIQIHDTSHPSEPISRRKAPNVPRGRVISTFDADERAMVCLTQNDDKRFALVLRHDGKEWAFKLGHRATALALLPNGLLATLDDGGEIRIWNYEAKEWTHTLRHPGLRHYSRNTVLTMTEDGQLLAVFASGKAIGWNLAPLLERTGPAA